MASEKIVEVYRFGEGGGSYESCCILVYPEPDLVYIKGVASPLKLSHVRELKGYLISQGVKEAIYQRHGRWKFSSNDGSVSYA